VVTVTDEVKSRLNKQCPGNSRVMLGTLIQNIANNVSFNTIDLDTTTSYPHKAGRLSYDPVSKTVLADTGINGVRVNVGQENHIRFINKTGSTITNGQWLYPSGVDATNKVMEVGLADASSPLTSLSLIGVATSDIENDDFGLATWFGEVRGLNTDAFIEGTPIYLSTTPGDATNTRPRHPNVVFLLGTVVEKDASEGIIQVVLNPFVRATASKSYSFTSRGITAGTYWKGGFYDWSTTSVTLTQASTTQTYGTVGQTYAAHAGIVPSAPGTVDAGQVGLRVTGIKDSETGTQTAAQTGIVTEDITTLTANVMAETSEKFSGQVTYELYVVSGSPTTYSLSFNYGYAKYDDLQNRDITVTGFECLWEGAATDTAFDISLMHHKPAGWTYAASGFVPGNGYICRKTIDQALAGDVVNGKDGAYKRVDLNQFIEGAGSEGVLVKIETGQNNTIQTMDIHLDAVSEELTS
jgi:hypothetical protein